ncbi:MAG: argininosuccinate lyase [Mucilaginibacter polytrichastri]|nr:argininosuccinate lyase [Mucilaginibacter polytrichastri]
MSKLWQKNTSVNDHVEQFTVGNDRELDHELALFDVLGSLAHTQMLQTIDLLSADEQTLIRAELRKIHGEISSGDFRIEEGVEDVHSQVELMLTRRIGEAGKKIHSGRSRNDQVLVDLKLFYRHRIEELVSGIKILFDELTALSEKHKDVLLPGYTHLQVAMPSSFGLWFGAYAESLSDDLESLLAAWNISNRNPLGSAAGYGSSFPLNRRLTTELLGFSGLHYNVVAAQMSRGKTERVLSQALSNVAATLNKLATDSCLFMSQNFAFISFPDELTTGSSIMPHKKNPDVWELMRGKSNQLQSLPNQVALICTNLPSGYFRDMQLLKEILFPAFNTLQSCLDMAVLMLRNIRVKTALLDDERYTYVFSVEKVNALVLGGMPFREAYKKVGLDIEAGNFAPDKTVNHTHEGSIGNLCTDDIKADFTRRISRFGFDEVHAKLEALLS